MGVSENVLSNVLRVRKAERTAIYAREQLGREQKRLARILEENGIPSCSAESIKEATSPFDQDLWELALIHPDVCVHAPHLKQAQREALPEMRRIAKQLVNAGGLQWTSKVITFD